ncbi:hypothetical protein WME89_49210 [Sorangium sp. So ce321]|uniref:hypothetical protein n=1 Tax=Sorangium sp. So ce321 TaxID=3133300 RepID=UPI003F60D7CC
MAVKTSVPELKTKINFTLTAQSRDLVAIFSMIFLDMHRIGVPYNRRLDIDHHFHFQK